MLTALAVGIGVFVAGIGLMLVAMAITDVRDELIRFRQDYMTLMQRQSGGQKQADVGEYMRQQLRAQGRLPEEEPCEQSD